MLVPTLAAGLAGLAFPVLPEVPGHDSAPVVHVVRTVVQTRYQQTAVTVVPGLESLVVSQNPALAASNLTAIRDTARADDGLSLRRAWLELEANPLESLRGELRVDFARLLDEDNPFDALEVALGEVRLTRGLDIGVGRFELPFSLFELVHDPDFELAEKGPIFDLLEHLGYAGSDTGAFVRVAPLRKPEWLWLTASATNGEASGAQQFRGPGILAGRVLSTPIEAMRLGAGVSYRPKPAEAWWEEFRFHYRKYDPGLAYGADLTLTFAALALRAEWLSGDRTDVNVETPRLQRRGDARTFHSAWAMATVRVPVGNWVLVPALRGEWLDSDVEHARVGGIVHLSAGLNVDFTEHWRLLWDLSQHYVEPGTRNWGFDIVRYDTDSLTGTMQLQLEL